MGGLLAVGAASLFFWGMKLKEERWQYMTVFVLAFLLLILIRARADLFALILCVLFVFVKESELHLKANVKTVVGILSMLLIAYITFNGFVKDELNRFMLSRPPLIVGNATGKDWTLWRSISLKENRKMPPESP